MTRLPKISARKWNGDDAASWAVFIAGQARPFVSGLTRSEVPYYREQARLSVLAAAEKVAGHEPTD